MPTARQRKEAALPPADAFFRILAESTSTAIVLYDQRRILYGNPATEALTGYSTETLTELNPDELILPEDLQRAREIRHARLAGESVPLRYELRIRTRQGLVRWLDFTATTLEIGGRRVALATAVDITEHKQLEETLTRKVAEERTLAELARRFLNMSGAADAIDFDGALERLARLFGACSIGLHVADASGSLQPTAGWPERPSPVALPPEVVERLEADELVEVPATLLAESEGAEVSEPPVRLVPISSRGRLLGSLSLTLDPESTRNESTRRVLPLATEIVAAALARQRAERELAASRERLELAQRAGRSVVWEWDLDDDTMLLSTVAIGLFGFDDETLPRTGGGLLRAIPAEDRLRINEAMRQTVRYDVPYSVEHRVITPTGQTRWLAVRGVAVRDETGRARRILGVSAEITERKLAEEALLQEKERAQVTLASIGDGVIRTDAEGRVDYMNPTAEAMTGVPLDEAYGRPLEDIYRVLEESTRKPRGNLISSALAEGQLVIPSGHSLLVRDDGAEFAIRDSAAPIRGRRGELLGSVVVFKDVSQLRGLEREMSYLAAHDPLTGLPNRREFERRLRAAILSAREEQRVHAIFYLDLDDFKLVNDTCGHIAGDELLKQLSALLSSLVRESDTLARLGGDEFGVLLEDCPLPRARQIAEKLRAAVRSFRFSWEERIFEVGASIGVVPLDELSGSLDELMSSADAACYVAKDSGRNRVHLYRPDDRALAERYGEMQWIHRINRAFEEGRMLLYQQPIVPVNGSAPPLAEILIRMKGEDGSLIPASSFIAAAERYHLIPTLDRWVLRTTLSRLAHLPPERGAFTINLSGQSVGEEAFLEFALRTLDQSHVNPKRVLFEITETAAISNLPRARELIQALRRRGCRFVLDDFGSGLSSFAYLKNLPVDFLKIDGEFVRHMVDDPIQQEMVSAINRIGHVMKLRTIGESVETEETMQALRALQVDYAQGFFVAYPEPFGEE